MPCYSTHSEVETGRAELVGRLKDKRGKRDNGGGSPESATVGGKESFNIFR